MSSPSRWILVLPVAIFSIGVVVYFSTENEIRVQFERAQDYWRVGQVDRAAEVFRSVAREYPESLYAQRALWELGMLNHVSRYDASQALECYHRLLNDYPRGSFSAEVLLKIAEIHSIELQDQPEAIAWWKHYLEMFPHGPQYRRALFQLGNAYFQLSDLDTARAYFQQVIDEAPDDDLAHRSGLRIGAICQLEKDYEASVPYFEAALSSGECTECRLQGQLGLIESLEFLEELPRALEVARSIDTDDYSASLKQDLVSRLNEKMKYYEPRLWNKTP